MTEAIQEPVSAVIGISDELDCSCGSRTAENPDVIPKETDPKRVPTVKKSCKVIVMRGNSFRKS